ncbi:DUF5666 domain-containing protein [Azospirillum sp. TSA6c]|uniref:DUF5666 domain-containing protein n=1 Tax=unclassified Azospirillum TaxID=2630922 RepID=UPI002493E284|nr:DUF5666 domain-containing protein [Azospirillum sp. TSA6c]
MTRKFTPLARTLLLTLMLAAGCGPTPNRDGGIADRGIGGTGVSVADRGIGGTGIVGTVTAFGSVWVNGLRVDLPQTTQVRIEGRPAQPGDVRIGQTVAMTVTPGGPTGLTAQTLEVRFAVAGPVERTTAGSAPSAVVLGQRIDLAEAEGTTALTPGRWVAISGLRRPDGVIDASRVDSWEPARGWVLRGRLDSVTPKTLTVAGLTLSRGRSLTGALPAVGSIVRVAGKPDPAAAFAVEADPFNPFGSTVSALSIETYVDASGQTTSPGGPRIGRPDGEAAAARVVIDSVVTSGGGIDRSRSFGAQRLGGRSLDGADPAARAAGLARAGMRSDGQQGPDAPGMEGPEGPLDGVRTHPGWGAPPGPYGGPYGGPAAGQRPAAGPNSGPDGSSASGAARAASPPSSMGASPESTAAPTSGGFGGRFGGPGRGRGSMPGDGGSPHGGPRGGFGGGFGGGPDGGRGGHF